MCLPKWARTQHRVVCGTRLGVLENVYCIWYMRSRVIDSVSNSLMVLVHCMPILYKSKQVVATSISAPYKSRSTCILNAALRERVPVVAAASTDSAAGFCISQMSAQASTQQGNQSSNATVLTVPREICPWTCSQDPSKANHLVPSTYTRNEKHGRLVHLVHASCADLPG